MPSPVEVPRAPGAQPRSASTIKAKDSSGKDVEPPLEVMPISVWSPPAQSAEPPPSIAKDLGRKRPEADGDEDSLLSNVELVVGAISSILRDSNLKRSGAFPVEEVLALSVRPEKIQFLEKGQNRNFGYKILILVKNPKFILWISDDETDFAIGIVSRNLASTSNFVESRDSQNLHIFRGIAFRVS